MSTDLFPRCPKCGAKGHAWHGFPCDKYGCGCASAWDEPEEVA